MSGTVTSHAMNFNTGLREVSGPIGPYASIAYQADLTDYSSSISILFKTNRQTAVSVTNMASMYVDKQCSLL